MIHQVNNICVSTASANNRDAVLSGMGKMVSFNISPRRVIVLCDGH
jgi:hypothetical protein